ncbi:hypothetical protein WME88_14795 [Sorangium sp. So ce216]
MVGVDAEDEHAKAIFWCPRATVKVSAPRERAVVVVIIALASSRSRAEGCKRASIVWRKRALRCKSLGRAQRFAAV